MAKRPPEKDAPLWHPLPDPPEEYAGVEIGLKYVGAHEARSWMIRMQKLNLEEKARQLKDKDASSLIEPMRAALTQIAGSTEMDEAKRLAEAALSGAMNEQSLDFIEAINALTIEVLERCVFGARGVEGLAEDDAQGALEILEYMGGEMEGAVFNLCQEQQSLSLRQRFRAARSGLGG